jgi:putative ATP-binding cassette transporter
MIADWRATLLRVALFRHATITAATLHRTEDRIILVDGEPGKLTIDHLEIASPSGCIKLKESRIDMKRGERILISGEAERGKTLLFRALAGLWPWGAGRVIRPKAEAIFCMPRTPYLPPGTLREVLAYPSGVESFADTAFRQALSRFGLEHLLPMLDTPRRWDRELGEDTQQSLAFARCLLHAPQWILVDDIFGALEEKTLQRILAVFSRDLERAALVHIGRSPVQKPFFSRVLHLVQDPAVRRLPRRTSAQVNREAPQGVF